MPLPLGHAAIGLATYETATNVSAFERWKHFLWIIILANLPDLDVLLGLIVHWNGQAFHRGATHSLVFALVAGFLAHGAGKRWKIVPQLSFYTCFFLILSHVVADALLTASPVSFWWPLEIHLSAGHAGWMDVVHTVVFDGYRDAGIVLFCGLILLARRLSPARLWRWMAQRTRQQPPPA
ncbi:MAG TPA: metal-dependent hydrolase [Desulfobacterales bacterium]